jgi:hypothetical protein
MKMNVPDSTGEVAVLNKNPEKEPSHNLYNSMQESLQMLVLEHSLFQPLRRNANLSIVDEIFFPTSSCISFSTISLNHSAKSGNEKKQSLRMSGPPAFCGSFAFTLEPALYRFRP